MAKSTVTESLSEEDVDAAAVDAIARALEGLQVEIQVHDARVVRIMRTERVRFYEECTSKAP
jgi:hypothetical protein